MQISFKLGACGCTASQGDVGTCDTVIMNQSASTQLAQLKAPLKMAKSEFLTLQGFSQMGYELGSVANRFKLYGLIWMYVVNRVSGCLTIKISVAVELWHYPLDRPSNLANC